LTVDVAVVGGGPAGSSTALRLAQEGYEVALFDRAVFPRSKPCGEFLNPEAARLLRDDLGVDLPADASPVSCISLVPEHGEPLLAPLLNEFGNPTAGYSLPRVRTDYLLLESARKAGVRINEGSNVRSTTLTGVSGHKLSGEPFECRARLVIACDGSNSLIARQRGLVRPIPRLKRIGVVVHFAGITLANNGVVKMFCSRKGAWGVAGFSAQAGGRAVLSAVVPSSAGKLLAADGHVFVQQMVRALPGLAETLDGATIEDLRTAPSFGHRLSRSFDEGVLFVGDAAQFIDPFTGEGVHHALAGGLLAAETAKTSLECGDVSAASLSPYGAARKELNSRYAACDLIQALVTRPWLIDFAVRNLRGHPRAAEKLIGVLVDLLPPQVLFSPRVLAGALIPSFK
jgi:flavin-dependent dehydrogenase